MEQRVQEFRRSDDPVTEQIIGACIKAADHLQPVHLVQVLTYLKLGGYRTGLLVNFNVTTLKRGLRRLVTENCPPDPSSSFLIHSPCAPPPHVTGVVLATR